MIVSPSLSPSFLPSLSEPDDSISSSNGLETTEIPAAQEGFTYFGGGIVCLIVSFGVLIIFGEGIRLKVTLTELKRAFVMRKMKETEEITQRRTLLFPWRGLIYVRSRNQNKDGDLK